MSSFRVKKFGRIRSANGAVSLVVSSKLFHFVNGNLAFLVVLADEKKGAVILLDFVLGVDVFLFSLINLLENHPFEGAVGSRIGEKLLLFEEDRPF